MNKNPIFCAIDTNDIEAATSLVEQIKPHIGGIKLGLEFFTSCGISGCHTMKKFNLPLFIDFKNSQKIKIILVNFGVTYTRFEENIRAITVRFTFHFKSKPMKSTE